MFELHFFEGMPIAPFLLVHDAGNDVAGMAISWADDACEFKVGQVLAFAQSSAIWRPSNKKWNRSVAEIHIDEDV